MGERLCRTKTHGDGSDSWSTVEVDIYVPAGTEVEVWRAGDRPQVQGLSTDEYRAAVQHTECPGCAGAFSDDDHTPPMRDWHDKPHRLVYDLCNEIDALRAGDRPVPPTREHLHFTLIRALPYIEDVKLGEIADEILALLSGGVPTEEADRG